jgi:predicted N-acetyltransferase YhbS
LAATALELRLKQAQVVVLDEAQHAGDSAWTEAFGILLQSDTVKAFPGAVVFCVAEETPVIRSVCSQRWTGVSAWIWQDDFESADLEILEDVLTNRDKDVDALLEEVAVLSDECFNEDSVEKAASRGWVMSLLTASTPAGGRSLAGSICFRPPTPPAAELHIARLAVPKNIQRGGCGQRLMLHVLTKASRMPQSECQWISLSALDTAVPFYEKFGFTDMTTEDVDHPDHFQTWMELKNVSIVSGLTEPANYSCL